MRTACYARFSTDLQRDTSLEDQIRECRTHAERAGWTWQPDQVYTDAGITAASLDGRPGFARIMALAALRPRPFDVLLIDDSSRMARDLADALRTVQLLKFFGVKVVLISQGIDSDHEQAEVLIGIHGIIDSMYLKESRAKIKRGLRGQIQRGYATGRRTFGYRTTRVANPDAPDDTIGFAVAIEPREADVIRGIFEEYAAGVPVRRILERLIREQAPCVSSRGWMIHAVNGVLANEKYTGKLIWGRTSVLRRPGTRKKTTPTNPRDQWEIVERPDLRIISDELWTMTQQRRREWAAITGGRLMRGRSALAHSRTLFGGFLRCGVCGAAVGQVLNVERKGVRYRYYGCTRHAHGGTADCGNNLRARVEHADAALLDGLQAELCADATVRYITDRVAAAVNAAIDARPAARAALEDARAALTQKIRHLTDAVEAGAGTGAVLQALQVREDERRALDAQLATYEDALPGRRLAVLPTWVRQQLQHTADMLRDGQDRARAVFRDLDIRFVVAPVDGDGKPFLRATGSGAFDALAFQEQTVLSGTVATDPRQSGNRKSFTVDLPTARRQSA